MASQSPQRSRRTQPVQQLNQGAMLNHQTREASPSPPNRERPRALKAQSMPLVPSVTAFGVQQPPQPSPTIPNRRSPPLGQVQRLLPTPPHPNPPNFTEDRRMSPPPSNQVNVNPHYPRPPLRAPTAGYPNKFIELESQMTPEFFADIDRAAEQAQYQSNQSHSYPSIPRADSPSSGKGTAVERARVPADRSSPSNPDVVRSRREQQISRESPQNRQQASPITFQSHSPERRMSPAQSQPVLKPGEPHPASYLAQYNARETAPAPRRAPNSEQRLSVSMASLTPPLQTISARTPDRSLPVQEEDEVTSKNTNGSHPDWKVNHEDIDQPFRTPSPTPSSDINPDGSASRFENGQATNGHRDDLDKVNNQIHDDHHAQYAERDSTEEDGSYTPRSPAAGLPEENRDMYYSGQNIPIRAPVAAPVAHRGKARNGTSDHITRGLDSALLDQQHQQPSVGATEPQQSQSSEQDLRQADQRQRSDKVDAERYQDYPSYNYGHSLQQAQNGRYVPPQVYPDDFQGYGEEYLHAYLHSPRPDAPVPPTPHSQTAAPSPSPLLQNYGLAKEMLAYRPMRAAGSPYPFPFNHVRRNRQMQPGPRFYPNGVDQSTITDKVARQWQIFAQNNQGNITDSTFSPSSTPFQPDLYDEWAYLHTTRLMRQNAMTDPTNMHDNASISSSPSHQPIPLPLPLFSKNKKKDRETNAKRQAYSRKPPPRVESTQPRETSPELSSSGEETAGEERYTGSVDRDNVAIDPLPFPVAASSTTDVDSDSGEWVDEDDDDDYEDLIDLEYHPAFVKNISKRRRKWEVGWENLIQAFQALDRQTDATMLLLASPSHTTKLHAVKSRSIRKHSILANSSSMNEIRSGFAHIAAQRRTTRPDKSSLVDRILLGNTSSSGDGSDGSSGSVELNLKRALEAALGSLNAMGEVYDEREARVREELRRSREDRERVELLLRQVLGDKHAYMHAPLPRLAP